MKCNYTRRTYCFFRVKTTSYHHSTSLLCLKSPVLQCSRILKIRTYHSRTKASRYTQKHSNYSPHHNMPETDSKINKIQMLKSIFSHLHEVKKAKWQIGGLMSIYIGTIASEPYFYKILMDALEKELKAPE